VGGVVEIGGRWQSWEQRKEEKRKMKVEVKVEV
jgi:hypothetical protein